MITASTILLVFALVLFTLAAMRIPEPPRLSFIAAGLALWVLSLLLGGVLRL